ncbi:MAG: DEAD/DEAH box helicase family protein [Acetobacteraceae bacterium]|nr:DEAD/DEAH box helicase family protein [Acetobacteraceae bacterium]
MSGSASAAGGFEVPQPILNGPFDPPAEHWLLREGEPPKRLPGRRAAGYWYRDPKGGVQDSGGSRGVWRDMALVNTIRARMAEWQAAGRPGVTRTTAELMAWWEREGRQPRLFFAQREAAETVIFLAEARADFLQGLVVPPDEPSEDRKAAGFAAFRRHCAKMATGSGKSTVAGMLAAWSILNKQADRGDARFSDTVLIVCPNVTIRTRLGELDPQQGEASLYRTRDLVPPGMMDDLKRGRVIIRNWHDFEQRQPGGARVDRRGVPEVRTEWITIAARTTSARGGRYFDLPAYEAGQASGALEVLKEERNADGSLKRAMIRSTRYVESDTALVARVLGRSGSRQNILVINDEAHHAYRIPPKVEEENQELDLDEDDAEEEEISRKEATIWVEGLDRIHKVRGINQCIDLSATPYFLGRMGDATNTVFPWVVSDFSLTDAIESGLVKVPQLVARDSTGQAMPAFFNIWKWLLPKLTARERGTKRGSPQPEAILKWAHHSIATLGGMWAQDLDRLATGDDPRPPVFILVAKNKRIARALYEWIGEDKPPPAVPKLGVPHLMNTADRVVTIRVDTGVVHETDSGNAKSDDSAWMRLTLDTVGKRQWPQDAQGRPIYPDGFEALAAKLGRPLHPPGRDVRCIVSVGMLTEGWDCNTVSHVIGLRPFQSQLLCEQVVGRALRRRSYDLGEDGKLAEEEAYVFGVPFEVVPFKATGSTPKQKPKQRRIYAVPEKAAYAITIPRVMGYAIGVRNRVTVPDWSTVASLTIDPMAIPPESQLAAMLNQGRPSVSGPGGVRDANLSAFRASRREQELCFQMAAALTRQYVTQATCEAPPHVLFPQVLAIVRRYHAEKVQPVPPAAKLDAFLSPYWGWIIERLAAAIQPDTAAGEAPELPDIDRDHPTATVDISVFTTKDVREVVHSHVNLAVHDTANWEQTATYHLDKHPMVRAFVKNHGLNFVIPYQHNGESHDYVPDFVARLAGDGERYLITEVKGADWDGLTEVKAQAAQRWCAAINATGEFGRWDYLLAMKVGDLVQHLDALATDAGAVTQHA